jgi:hypothetical protein
VGQHTDSDGDGAADHAEQDIGDLDNEAIYIPDATDDEQALADAVETAHGSAEGPATSLRDPWFDTAEGKQWLTEQEADEQAAQARKELNG